MRSTRRKRGDPGPTKAARRKCRSGARRKAATTAISSSCTQISQDTNTFSSDSELSDVDSVDLERAKRELEEILNPAQTHPVATETIDTRDGLPLEVEAQTEEAPIEPEVETPVEVDTQPLTATEALAPPLEGSSTQPADPPDPGTSHNPSRPSQLPVSPPSTPPPSQTFSIPDPSTPGPETPKNVLTLGQEENVSDEIFTLSMIFYDRSSATSKPSCVGEPEVWADGRQALCETLPYYRSYQSCSYSVKGIARGFLFDGSSRARDYMDSDVVISSAGGGMVRDPSAGRLVYRGLGSKSGVEMRSIQNNINLHNPVVVISGDRNRTMPALMPHPYNVLGWFKPTNTWSEKVAGKIVDRYRFEILKAQDPPSSWWRPQGLPPLPAIGTIEPPLMIACSLCRIPYPKVYINGWMCLNKMCNLFWKINGFYEPPDKILVYDARFLRGYTHWESALPPHGLAPPPQDEVIRLLPHEATSRAAWRGMVCQQCGRCNSKTRWNGWVCGNPVCQHQVSIFHPPIPPVAFRDFIYPSSTTKDYLGSAFVMSGQHTAPLIRDVIHPSVIVHHFKLGPYRGVKYTIPGLHRDSFIAHLIASKDVAEEVLGPDSVWLDLQTQGNALGLTRCRLPSNVLRGEMLTQHFALNFGMPYKFVAKTNSRSFIGAHEVLEPSVNDQLGTPEPVDPSIAQQAPSTKGICAVRTRLNWAARELLTPHGLPYQEFNEMLLIGYFEEQSISYHDDGEPGVGSTIASLSLGNTGSMKFRLKDSVFHGVSERGVLCTIPPIPICRQYEARTRALQELCGPTILPPTPEQSESGSTPRPPESSSQPHQLQQQTPEPATVPIANAPGMYQGDSLMDTTYQPREQHQGHSAGAYFENADNLNYDIELHEENNLFVHESEHFRDPSSQEDTVVNANEECTGRDDPSNMLDGRAAFAHSNRQPNHPSIASNFLARSTLSHPTNTEWQQIPHQPPAPYLHSFAQSGSGTQHSVTARSGVQINTRHDRTITDAVVDRLQLTRKGASAPVLLDLVLAHGDIMLMHGSDIQQYIDHAATHDGKLRFAMTCRYIDPMSLPEEERADVERDYGHYIPGQGVFFNQPS